MTFFRTVPPCLLAALALGACTAADPGAGLSLEQRVAAPQFVALAGSGAPAFHLAAALPPEAGNVIAHHSQKAPGGVTEDVLLDGGAAARVRNGITLATPSDPRGVGAGLFGKPFEPAIRAELTAYFPGLAMQVIDRHSANAYGLYGLALGRGDKEVRCLYAWQWIDGAEPMARAGLAGPTGVRVRLCRSDRSLDELAASVDRLMLGRDAPADALSAKLEPAALAERHPLPRRHIRKAAARQLRRDNASVAAGPVASAAPQSVAEAIAYPAPEAAKLSMDLPAEAYRGPNASKARP